MSAIQEDEAKQYPDLYHFETNCIDFLLAVKHMRERQSGESLEDAIAAAKEMLEFLNKFLSEAK